MYLLNLIAIVHCRMFLTELTLHCTSVSILFSSSFKQEWRGMPEIMDLCLWLFDLPFLFYLLSFYVVCSSAAQ